MFPCVYTRVFPRRPDISASATFASCKIRENSACKLSGITDLVVFPQVFPQVWKTLGRDQTLMPLDGFLSSE
jgi:hypothetical protein